MKCMQVNCGVHLVVCLVLPSPCLFATVVEAHLGILSSEESGVGGGGGVRYGGGFINIHPTCVLSVGKYPVWLGFWECSLRKSFCEVCLFFWDCQLSGDCF